MYLPLPPTDNRKLTIRLALCLCASVVGFLAQTAFAQQSAPGPDRNAFTFTNYNLNLTIDPQTSLLTARGTITLRNDSAKPQSVIALQLGSQLKWASIKIAGAPIAFEVATLASDIDHTGQVTEATFPMAQPLASKATIDIEVGYSGNITQDVSRLTRLDVPVAQARGSDWDGITPDFIALRGVGHVVWYPVSLDPVLLGDGNKLFVELGAFRVRHAESSMTLVIGQTEMPVFSNGTVANNKSATAQTATVTFNGLTVDGPLLVMGKFENLNSALSNIFYFPEQHYRATEYSDAVKKVAPEVASWIRAPQQSITVIQHPEANAVPFESGPLLLTRFSDNDKAIQLQLAHTLAHAALPSSRAWIAEGLAHYAQAREKQVQEGHVAALTFLLDRVNSLALDEPEHIKSSPDSAARSLINSGDELLYRTKSMFVWWMLHDMLGDDPLIKALRNYRQADDKEATYVQRLIEAQAHRDLQWFFDDWVYRDRGLPDFHITQVYPRETLEGRYVVTVTVENLGDAGAEVPVRVFTKEGETLGRLEVMGRQKASARIAVPSPPLQVIVNDGSVPESDLSNNMWKTEEPKKADAPK